MYFRVKKAALTDVGVGHRVNQDAILLKFARSERFGRICFALVCDGLGGLSQGEIASSAFAHCMEKWFCRELVGLIEAAGQTHLDASQVLHRIRLVWQELVMEMNEELNRRGRGQGIRMGTTVVAFLLIGQHYLVMHVGDSRLYITRNGAVMQLTRDHSVVQKQIDAGILTPAQAAVSDKKSVLLQCIGASQIVRPDFATGTLYQDTSVLLCSDGFWRRLCVEEIYDGIRVNAHSDEEAMRRTMRRLISDVKHRGEQDNISVIFLRLIAEVPEPVCAAVCRKQAALC